MNFIPGIRYRREADKYLYETIHQLQLEDAASRHARLLEIGRIAGGIIELPHGHDIPNPETSMDFLLRAVDNLNSIDWLSSKVTVDSWLGCWAIALTSEFDSKGRARYPVINSAQHHSNSELAHRFVIRRLCGTLSQNQHLDHLCRNHACCNPFHVNIVTHAENVARGAAARKSVDGQLRMRYDDITP